MKRHIIITGASSGIGQALYGFYQEHFRKNYDVEVIGVSRRGPDWFIDLSERKPGNLPNLNVELLINCAGIMPFAENEKVMDTNFWGTYNFTTDLFSSLVKGACVINIASVSGIVPDAELPIYSASKAAVIALTKSWAKAWAPHIRVNCISPGFYRTHLVPEETPEDLIKTIPMLYEEKPIHLANVTEMIRTTNYLTGANIVVDGGVSL